MKHLFQLAYCLPLLAAASAACSATETSTPSAATGTAALVADAPPTPTPISRDGIVQRSFVNPHGDVDALLLTDGSFVRIPPTTSGVASKLLAGQAVHVEGEAVGAALHASQVRLKSGEVVVAEPSSPPAPPAPPPAEPSSPPAPPAPSSSPPPAPPAALARIEDTSTIERLVRGPRGEIDGVILADGAIVRIPRRLVDDAGSALAVGTRVHVEGEGGRYALGTSLRADRLRLDSGQTFVDPGPPGPRTPPPAPPAP